MNEAITAVREAMAEPIPGVLGLHIEGPFLDPERKGAHAARFLKPMTAEDVAWLTSTGLRRVLVTLAPNWATPGQVAELVAAGLVVSLGHSDAGFASCAAAIDAGARGFTHLFNAMSQMNGREPGMAGAALSDPRCCAGIIADGHHVHAATLKAAFAAMGPKRLMLVTDAMPPAAGGPPSFDLQGREVRLNDGRLELSDGTLAGSSLTMDQAVRHCVRVLGIELGAALRMASLTPATFLGVAQDLGRIAPGHLASLVHLDDDLRVRRTWIEGQ
jgi:N-acetylglucosamine-6-phosphate deacetylase